MADIKPDVMERVLANKFYWRRLAAKVIAESSQNVPRSTLGADSAIAPAPQLGQILESRMQQTRVRLSSSPSPGPRTHPMIAEVSTISASRGAVVISEKRAQRLRRAWDEGRRRGQAMVQSVDANPTTDAQADDGENPMRDHPGRSCGDAHPGMSHDDFKDQQEEEEEEHRNPLYILNSARARSISLTRCGREVAR